MRSLHPTHSVTAFGPRAEHWVDGHEDGASPCDAASPFARLLAADGAVLLLGGVTHNSNTTLHCLEELAGVPYHLQAEPSRGVVTDAEGAEHVVTNRLHLWGWDRWFDRVDPLLDVAGGIRRVTNSRMTATLVSGAVMADVVGNRIAADPLFLLADQARLRWQRTH